ncbi:Intraflagellar transport protein 43-like [Homarus americanus]|uniref:Intraflagellar transport protein 43-like n=1 Tax=Homarus americanus TaxID=6706 RepID=A0A8J5NBM5_HOMAM|nr:Intraflagellar transport protein 43-like [Homarus americanus]
MTSCLVEETRESSPRKGRRSMGSDSMGNDDPGVSASPLKTSTSSPREALVSGPPAGRRAGGWANSAKTGGFGPPQEDKRFHHDSDSDTGIVVAVNLVATYKELDSDLLRHAAFSTLDDIDLRQLTNSLANEADIREPDIQWKWDTIFTEVSSELRSEWEPSDETSERETIP